MIQGYRQKREDQGTLNNISPMISAYRIIPKSATDRVLELGIARSKLVNSLCFSPPRKRVKDRADHVTSHIIQGERREHDTGLEPYTFCGFGNRNCMLPKRRISMWYAMMAKRRMLTRRWTSQTVRSSAKCAADTITSPMKHLFTVLSTPESPERTEVVILRLMVNCGWMKVMDHRHCSLNTLNMTELFASVEKSHKNFKPFEWMKVMVHR